MKKRFPIALVVWVSPFQFLSRHWSMYVIFPIFWAFKIGGNPAMLESSKTMCAWAGSITVDKPGLTNVQAD